MLWALTREAPPTSSRPPPTATASPTDTATTTSTTTTGVTVLSPSPRPSNAVVVVDPASSTPKPTITSGCPAGSRPFVDESHTASKRGCTKDDGDGGQLEEGTWTFVDEQQKTTIVEFRGGLKEGVQRSWYQNGRLARELTYIHNLPEGVETEWNEDGERFAVRHYHDGALDGAVTLSYPDGRIIEEVWRGGHRIVPGPEPTITIKMGQ